MTPENQIIVADKAVLPVFQISSEALRLRDDALAGSALIGRVENAAQNESAVQAHIGLKRIQATFEKSRKQMKEPLLEAGRQLDRAVAAELVEIEKEVGRLANLTRDFAVAEQRRVREEQELQRQELERIERERIAGLAEADTPEQVQFVEEKAAAAVAVESKPVQATRSHGQILKEDWEITVTNPYELAKFHPDCVKIEPLLTPIKAALTAGIAVKGVRAEKVMKSNVRAGTHAAIEV